MCFPINTGQKLGENKQGVHIIKIVDVIPNG